MNGARRGVDAKKDVRPGGCVKQAAVDPVGRVWRFVVLNEVISFRMFQHRYNMDRVKTCLQSDFSGDGACLS